MYRRFNIRIIPTLEQEILFRKSCGVARWAYNFFLSEMHGKYEAWQNNKEEKKSTDSFKVLRYINNTLKKSEEFSWLKEVSGNVIKVAVKDAYKAYLRFFKGITGYPKFKKKGKSKDSFYVNGEAKRFYKTNDGFKGEKLGHVKLAHPLPSIPKNQIYSNPRIFWNGSYWVLSVGIKIEPKEKSKLNNFSLGIDLGVKKLAVCSNGMVFDNINKTHRIKLLEKRLNRAQRKLSRKVEGKILKRETENGKNQIIFKKPLSEYSNIQRQKRIIRRIYKHLFDIRTNYIHQTTRSIVKTKPCRIVMEDLGIMGLTKNKKMSKSIKDQKWYEFKTQIKYKCEEYGIAFVEADRFFPSTKMCSNCGSVKRTISLRERVYYCEDCKMKMDRDLNASINLANYK